MSATAPPAETVRRGITLVNSIPKSGTYLVARFLREIGATDSGLHFRSEAYWNFKAKPLAEVISSPDNFKTRAPLSDSLGLIKGGEFSLAHLGYSIAHEDILARYAATHIFLYRNIKDVLVSHFRFITDPRRKQRPSWLATADAPKDLMFEYLRLNGITLLDNIKSQAVWIRKENVIKVKFEDIIGDNGIYKQRAALDMLVQVTGLDQLEFDSVRAFNETALGQETRTYSGYRSKSEDYWSDETERLFIRHGGYEII